MFSKVGRALVWAAMLAGLVVFVRVFIGAPLNWPAVALDMAAMALPIAGLLWLRQRLEAGLPLAPMEDLSGFAPTGCLGAISLHASEPIQEELT